MVRTGVLAGAVALAMLTAPGGASAQPPTAPGVSRTARVTYIAGGSIYVDAGRAEGLAVGDTLALMRAAERIGWLRVTFLSAHSAACDTMDMTAPVVVGASVQFTISRTRTAPADASTVPAGVIASGGDSTVASGPDAQPRHLSDRIRGRVGAGYEAVAGVPDGIQRPSFDLRFDGRGLTRMNADVAVDLRARRSFQRDTMLIRTEMVSRLYRGSITLHPRPRSLRVSLGRQSSPSFSNVSLFDGGLLEWSSPNWGAGAFAGTQPDPERLAFSTDVAQAGLYLERRSSPRPARAWSLGLGAISSVQDGEPNRDFVFLQGSLRTQRGFATLLQEADINRGWRRDDAPGFELTSTFVSSQWLVAPRVAMRLGYDGRHAVRLYRDRLTPETEFDDWFRQGAWTGIGLDVLRALHLDADFRQRFGDAEEQSSTWGAGLDGRPVAGVRLRGRYSSHRSERIGSDLVSLGLGIDPGPALHLELNGGIRDDIDRIIETRSRTRWGSADLDLIVLQRWYVLASYEIDRSEFGDLQQSRVGVSWWF
jgi:hypothetical protein